MKGKEREMNRQEIDRAIQQQTWVVSILQKLALGNTELTVDIKNIYCPHAIDVLQMLIELPNTALYK
jgi:hypothetical protein